MITRYLKSPAWYGVGDSIVGQVRKANEDNCGYASTPNGELFVVCDGMGGHVGGATASRIAVDSIIAFLSQKEWPDKPQAIAEALRFANTQILGTAANDATLKGMGTTACIVLCEGQDVWIGHVGDSRIYLFDKRNAYLHRVTKDHSYVQALVDKGELDDRDAENHPQKNIIMRALGSKDEVVPEVEAIPLHIAAGDTLLICSDGLSGMIDDNEIEAILASKLSLENKAEKLINDANAPGKGKDNITVQLIQAVSSAFKQSTFPDFNPKWRQRAPKKKKSPWLWGSIIALLLILLSAGGFVGYKLIKGHQPKLAIDTTIKISESGENIYIRCSAKKVKASSSTNDTPTEEVTTQSVHDEQVEEQEEKTDSLFTGSQKGETVAQIQAREAQAKGFAGLIESYKGSLNNNKKHVADIVKEIKTLIKDLTNDTIKAQNILNQAKQKLSEANQKFQASTTTRTNIDPILKQLNRTQVEDQIHKAQSLANEFDQLNRCIGKDIQRIDSCISVITEHIDALKAKQTEKTVQDKQTRTEEPQNAEVNVTNDSIKQENDTTNKQ